MENFYEELETLRKEEPEATFGFMENIDLGGGITAYDFLHGECCQFAIALAKEFGYPIEVLRHSGGKLIHAYCRNGNQYVDARGCTSDDVAFFAEFDFECTLYLDGLYDEDGKCTIETFNTVGEFCDEIEEDIDPKIYVTAIDLIRGTYIN